MPFLAPILPNNFFHILKEHQKAHIDSMFTIGYVHTVEPSKVDPGLRYHYCGFTRWMRIV
jgi:hypothetical protein